MSRKTTKAEWQERAEHWRRVACEYAAHQRDPYAVPIMGALRLREGYAPYDWGDPETESRFIAPRFNEFKGMPPR